MKKKNTYGLIALILAAVLVGVYLKIIPMGGLQGTPDQPVTLQENKAAVTAICYDETSDATNGKVAADITVLKTGQQDGKTTNEGDGVVTYDLNAGYQAGDSVTVRCINNSDDGYYRNEVQKTLVIGENTIAVPVKHVGDISVTASASTLAVAANEMKSIDLDISADTQREYYNRPIVACKGEAGSLDGEVKSITISGFTSVGCDVDTLSGYTWCNQLDTPEYLSTSAIVDDAKFWVEATSSNPAGNLNCSIVDGVPYGGAGVAAINRANSYDSDEPKAIMTLSIAIT